MKKNDFILFLFTLLLVSVGMIVLARLLDNHRESTESTESRQAKVLKANSKQGTEYSTINDFYELTNALNESFSFPPDKRDSVIKCVQNRVAQVVSETTDFDELIDYGININAYWSYYWQRSTEKTNVFMKCNESVNKQVKYLLSKVYDFHKIFKYWCDAYPLGDYSLKSYDIVNLINERGAQIVSSTNDFNTLVRYWHQAHGRFGLWTTDLSGIVAKGFRELLRKVNKQNIPTSFLDVVEKNKIPDELKEDFKIKIEELR